MAILYDLSCYLGAGQLGWYREGLASRPLDEGIFLLKKPGC